MIDKKVFNILKSVLDEDEVLDLEENVERTKEQKIEDWNKLIQEYNAELLILDERTKDVLSFIERLHDMIKSVQVVELDEVDSGEGC